MSAAMQRRKPAAAAPPSAPPAHARVALSRRDAASAGDTVIVYTHGEVSSVLLRAGATLSTRFGSFRHDDMIGRPFGSKVFTREAAGVGGARGFLDFMRLTPELWSLALPHRTQILYFHDIAAVVLQLGLRPGAVVVESGTGSGSLTNALARAVAPGGRVHTFEFNAGRALKARAEFAELGIAGVVDVTHGDACAGFGRALDGTADAVFLDLPTPWAAIPHAHAALKPANGVICCFSPCIEQVQRTCLKLRAVGFEDVRTVEALGRDYDVLSAELPPPPIGVYCAANAHAAAAAAAADARAPPHAGAKRSRPEPAAASEEAAAGGAGAALAAGLVPVPAYPSWCAQPQPLSVRQVGGDVAGHSGYLTFATLYSKRLASADVLAGAVLAEDSALGLINRGSGGGGGSSSSSAAAAGGAAGGEDDDEDEEEEDGEEEGVRPL